MSDPRPRPAAPAVDAAEHTSDAAVLEVPADKLFQDWRTAHERAVAYLAALGVPAAEREPLARAAVQRALRHDAWDPTAGAIGETLRALREILPEAWRPQPPVRPGMLRSMPRLTRGSMVPRLEPRGIARLVARFRAADAAPPDDPTAAARADPRAGRPGRRRDFAWVRVAHRRRLLLAVLVLIPSVIASAFMVNVLPHQGGTWLEAAIVLFFGALFGWISIGFWTALLGFGLVLRGRDTFAITRAGPSDGTPFRPGGRTAIVMPICEEPVDRVFAGLEAIQRSLERTGAAEHFDLFVLSDSGEARSWVEEEEAWARICRELDGAGRIFYRRRRVRLRRKSGNVADFFRRWGRQYRYTIMLDADSVMTGATLVRLVEMMEAHPNAGMIQTAPTPVHRRSLLGRVQQFTSRLYGPMFAAGLHWWQLGDGQYWGHNAIIRTAPFMEHCALPRLKGKPPLGGEILSHDFVEAALMGRAGWSLWLAYDLPGSFEEVPSSLLEEMKRDRRWCQGNLQHLRVLFTEGLFGAHRVLFLQGVLSYVSAALWFCFLLLSTAEAIQHALVPPDYFPSGPSLFPEWPVWRPDWAMAILGTTAVILFLPKILCVLLLIVRPRLAAPFGGVVRVFASAVLEILLSSLFAPIRMVFHTKFVVLNLLGRTITWRSAEREDSETGWGEAIRHHGLDTLFATAWGSALYWLNPDYFWWITPIIGALILSVPLSVLASRVSLGERARALGLFLIPEETDPPRELRDLEAAMDRADVRAAARPPTEVDGMVRAAVDPGLNALHHALLGGPRRLRASIQVARRALFRRALAEGPSALSPRERRILLMDPDLVRELHARVWEETDPTALAPWGRPG